MADNKYYNNNRDKTNNLERRKLHEKKNLMV